jgi:hypothetical protein
VVIGVAAPLLPTRTAAIAPTPMTMDAQVIAVRFKIADWKDMSFSSFAFRHVELPGSYR